MIDLSTAEPVAVCPVCSGRILDAGEGYICEKSQADKTPCGFKVSKVILKQPIDREQIEKLVITGRTDLLKHFVSLNSNRLFAAFLVLRDNQKVTFEFPATENLKINARDDLLTRMALKLEPCFLGVVFPVAIAVLGVFELVAGLG